MGALASYFPTMEEVEEPDFLNAGLLVESRVEVERAVDNMDAVDEVHATLEQLCVAMESAMQVDPWVPTFVNHTLDAIGRRTGIRVPTASLEDNALVVSSEGIGSAIAAIWQAIKNAAAAAANAVSNFFRRIFELVTGKKSRIESNFAKAKEAGDSKPHKLASENGVDKIKDEKLKAKIQEKLDAEKNRSRPNELVVVKPATVRVVNKSNELEHGESAPVEVIEVPHKGETVVLIAKKDLDKAKYVKVGFTGPDFMSHAHACGMKLKPFGKDSVVVTMDDLTEFIWASMFRATSIREVGHELARIVWHATSTLVAELKDYFAQGKNTLEDWHHQDGSIQFRRRMIKLMQPVAEQFMKLAGNDGYYPCGTDIYKVTWEASSLNPLVEERHTVNNPELRNRNVLIEIPSYMESKKASDGTVSMMVLTNTKAKVVAEINAEFNKSLELWGSMLGWIAEQGHGEDTGQIEMAITNLTQRVVSDTQSRFTRCMNSMLQIEGTIVQMSDALSTTMVNCAASKDLVKEFA